MSDFMASMNEWPYRCSKPSTLMKEGPLHEEKAFLRK
jgi:hypothetical protein